MSCCDEYCANHGCNQGDDCPVRIAMAEMGEPYKYTKLDGLILAVALVFVASCIGYAWGGWR